MRGTGRAVVGAAIAATEIGALTGCSDQSGDGGDGKGGTKAGSRSPAYEPAKQTMTVSAG